MPEKLPRGCLHGRILKRLDVAGLILTETAHSAKSYLPRHAHESSYFCFVLQGIYTEFYRRQESICKPATLTFRPAGEIHEDRFHNDDGRVFVLEIGSRWLERLRENSLTLQADGDYRGGLLPKLAARLNHEFHQTDSAASLVIEGLALEIMAEATRRNPARTGRAAPRWLTNAHEILSTRFTENLTLTDVAAEVDIHPVHLASAFRRRFGCTVGEFVRAQRIERACRDLVAENQSLAMVALEAGFADQSHFSKAFKLYTGLTPTNYRKAALNR